MNEFLFYSLCGVLTAVVTAVVLHPLRGEKRFVTALMVVIPLVVGVGYMLLGHPDVSSAAAVASDDQQILRRQVMLLAEKPFEVIEKTGGNDASTLAVMADLNLRLGSEENAKTFLKRAISAAEKSGDIKADIYRERLKKLP